MIWSGDLELMIQRWMLFDDGWGVGEALNETNESGENGQSVKLRMKLVIEGKDRRFEDGIPWVKQA